MYSDKWMSDISLHKSPEIEINSATNIYYWLDENEQLVGVCINFELPDDIHYELKAENWLRFLDEVLGVNSHDDIIAPFSDFLNASIPQVDLGTALDTKHIEYKKISFYNFED